MAGCAFGQAKSPDNFVIKNDTVYDITNIPVACFTTGDLFYIIGFSGQTVFLKDGTAEDYSKIWKPIIEKAEKCLAEPMDLPASVLAPDKVCAKYSAVQLNGNQCDEYSEI